MREFKVKTSCGVTFRRIVARRLEGNDWKRSNYPRQNPKRKTA